VHVHRRTGFAATWSELQRDLREGPERSVGRLLSGTSRAEGLPADFSTVAEKLVECAGTDIDRLKAWWVYRMAAGLRERWRDQVVEAVSRSRVPEPEAARRAVALILASPEAQLT
jgi:hypothetical protein